MVLPPQVLPQAEDWLLGVTEGASAWATSHETELPSDLELSEEQQLQVLGAGRREGARRVPQGPPLTLPPTDLQGAGRTADQGPSAAGAARG